MASLVLGAAGAVVGSFFGPVGASIGWALGSYVGTLLDPPKSEGPRLSDLKLQTSTYGQMIPILYGTMGFGGNVIWQTDLVESSETSGGKGGSEPEVTTYTYSASFAVLICEGPITGIDKIWADGRVVWNGSSDDEDFPFTLYLGDETQLPDPTIEADKGAGNVPAHRGTAYVVFDSLPLTQFGNRIPILRFEATTTSRLSGLITRVASEPHSSPQWPPSTTITAWSTDWSSVQELGEPTDTVVAVSIRFDTTVLGVSTSHRYFPFGEHIYADGTSSGLLYGRTNRPIQGGSIEPVLTDGSVGNVDQVAIGTNVAESFGLPNGRFVYGASLTQNGRTLYVFTAPSTDIGSNIADTWHKIVNGVIVSTGTIIPGLSSSTLGWGNYAVYNVHTVSMFENSGNICWYYQGNIQRNFTPPDYGSVYIRKITGVNYADDATAGVAGPIQTGMDYATGVFAGHPSIYITEEGYAGTIGGTQTALWTRYIAGGELRLSEIVADLSDRSGLAPSEYNVTALPDIVPGVLLASQMTTRNAIQPTRETYFYDGVESDGVVKFVKRGGPSIITIPDDDLAARSDGSDAPALLQTIRAQEVDLPRIVSVDYVNAAADFQVGTQYEQRQVGSSISTTTLNLPISMSDAKAKAVASTQLFQEHLQRERFLIYVSRKYAKYEPTDVINVRGRDLRIVNKTEAPNGVIRFEGVLSRASIYVQPLTPGVGTGFTSTTSTTSTRSLTTLLLLDIPLISDTDLEDGFYAAMGPTTDGAWSGAALFKSVDGGVNYTEVATTGTAAVMGHATHVLSDFFGGNIFDELNTIQVVLDDVDSTLVSTTELGVLNGANLALLGFEVIQYKNAVLTAASTYTLSGLLRGRRGTEWATAGHMNGERFVALPTLNVSATFAELGQARLYKAVTLGGTLSTTPAQTFTNNGVALQPYSPVQVGGGSNAAGDITVNWNRRTRKGGEWRDYAEVPLSESSEGYVVQVWNSTYSQVARVTTGITTPTWVYTAAMQTTDFGATQLTAYVTVAQVGKFLLGTQARGAVAGIGVDNDPVLVPIPAYASGPSSPPPGSAGAVNLTQTYPTDSDTTTGFVIGNTYTVQFTTSGAAVTGGLIYATEATGTTPTYRHGVLTTDLAGLNVVANGDKYGNSVAVLFGTAAGSAPLASSTIYYLHIKNELASGGLSGPVGRVADMRINLVAASSSPVFDYDFGLPRLSGLYLTEPTLSVRFYADHVSASLGRIVAYEYIGEQRYRSMAVSNAPGDDSFSPAHNQAAATSTSVFFTVGVTVGSTLRLEVGNYYYVNLFGYAWQPSDGAEQFAVEIYYPAS